MTRFDPILLIRLIISFSVASIVTARADSPFSRFDVIGFGRHADGREYAVLRDIGMVYPGDTLRFDSPRGEWTIRITGVSPSGVKAEVLKAPPKPVKPRVTPTAPKKPEPEPEDTGARDPFTPVRIAKSN